MPLCTDVDVRSADVDATAGATIGRIDATGGEALSAATIAGDLCEIVQLKTPTPVLQIGGTRHLMSANVHAHTPNAVDDGRMPP